MRKFLLLFITCLLSGQCLWAQMTDDQVVTYAKQRHEGGATKEVIGQELVARGVSKDQIQRVYSKYMEGNAGTTSTTAVNYLRETNGETAPQDEGDTKSSSNQVFGRDIFRAKLLSFEPNMNLAIPQNYVLGAGDELIVDVYGNSQQSDKYTIAPDGTVTIPRLGPVAVSGLSVEAAQRRISAALGVHYAGSSIKLSVGQTRTISINVMGEVVTPGTYTLSAFATVFHALYMAGGINDIGTLRNVQVVRRGRIITVVDIYDYILKGRLAGNVHLQDNDVIIVGPYDNLVHISGPVRRPMWYEMKKKETLLTLLNYAGDFSGNAYRQSINIERVVGERKSVYTVQEFEFGTFHLVDQDSVIVHANENRYKNSVVIHGAVLFPGNYELEKANTFGALVEQSGGLRDDAQTNRAVLLRTKPDLTKEAITIDIRGILDGTEPDIALRNEDVVTIASMAQRNNERTLTIEGEVYNPGTIGYAEGMTIEDLITMAGGLRESASLLNVEVARRIVDPSASKDQPIRSEKFDFTLNDSLAVGSENKFKLQPYDQVYIRRSPVYNHQQHVNISGEVMFAGNYVLENQDTRISEIVKRAGGFKEKACVVNARLLRTMNEEERTRRQQKIQMAMSSVDSIDVTKADSINQYSVGINLAKAIENPGSDFDIVLRDGDQIIVPQYNSTVRISGEVLYPNTVTYVEGKKKDYYITAAGGYTKESIKRRAYIIYANGEVAKLSKGTIQPGCEIVVPQKKHVDNSHKTTMWVGICATIVSMLAVIANVIRN